MATPFRLKRSAVSGKRPTLSDLQLGELALNTYDAYLYGTRDAGGVGIGTTVTLLTPWTENFGAASIYYENVVGVGTTNPTSKFTVQGDVLITGFSTVRSNFTVAGVTTTQHLRVTGFTTTVNQSITGVATIGTLAVSGVTTSRHLNVAGVATFNQAKLGVVTSYDLIANGDYSNTINVGNDLFIYHVSDPLYRANFIHSDEYNLVLGNKSETGGNTSFNVLVGIFTGNDAFSNNTSYVSLNYGNSDTKLNTIGAGVTIYGTAFTNQLNVSGVSTLGTGVTITSGGNINAVSGVITATQFVTGAGAGITITNNTIFAPTLLVLDPSPAGVGTTSGVVQIKGDLYVDGTQFVINSSIIELGDFNIGIATTVGTNALLDGAGLGIGSVGIRKNFTYASGSDSLKSSENFDLASGKVYKINGTEVLSATQLTVANVNAVGVSTLGTLAVAGVTTTQHLNVTGFTTVVNQSIAGVATVGSNLAVVGVTTTQHLNVTGFTTVVNESVTGVATIGTLAVSGVTTTRHLNVVGFTTVVNQSVTGVATVGTLAVSGVTTTQHLNVTGFTTVINQSITGVATVGSNLTVVGVTTSQHLNVTGFTTVVNQSVTGVASVGSNLGVAGVTTTRHLNVTGFTTVVNQSITGVATVGSNLAVAGVTTTQHLNVTGFTTVVNQSITGVLTVTNGIQGIGIQSAGFNIAVGLITAINFVGAGNSFSYNSGTKTVDINIGGSQWTFVEPGSPTTSSIYRVNGNVGIGTTNPTSKLHLVGDALVTGISTFTGNVSFGSSAYFGDNDTLYFGDGNDLEIYHNGSNSFIRDVGTGGLFIDSSELTLRFGSSERFARFLGNGAAELYYDNVKQFETTGAGVTVFGTTETQQLVVSGVSTLGVTTFVGNVSFGSSAFFGDNDSLYFGDGNDLRIYHNGNNSIIEDTGDGSLLLRTNGNLVRIQSSDLDDIANFYKDGSVELYHDNSKKFETAGYGATVFGVLQTQGLNVTGFTTVVNQSITGVATIGTLAVSGVTTTQHLNVTGFTTVVNQSITGVATIGTLAVSGVTTTRHLNVIGFTTVVNQSITGVATIATLNSSFATLTNINSTGITTLGIVTAGQVFVSGVTTSAGGFVGNLTGIAASATKLVTPRTFEITGDVVAAPISFDGTGNVSLAATIQPNSVGLGTDTFGDYVRDITGTANQITVTSGTGEGSTPTLSVPNQFTAPQDVTVIRDLQVNRNLNVNGNITIGGTSATLFTTELKIFDPDIVLGFRTDTLGNDVSNDNTANHGGVAIASTEGTPLVQLFIAGIETNPATYKKIMWFKSGTFSGLGTDAWLSNYAIGIGSTQVPNGVRLAAGNVQITQNDLAVVRNINASGIATAITFNGQVNAGVGTITTLSGTTATYTTLNGTTGNINTGIITTLSGTTATYTTLNGTTGNINTGIITTLSGTNLNYSGISTIRTLGVAGVTTTQHLNVTGFTTVVNQSITGVATVGSNLAVAGVTTTQHLGVVGVATISVSSSSDALRITQTGSGNALVVEDEANPDATPFVVRGDGNLGIGTTNPAAPLHIASAQPIIRLAETDAAANNRNWNVGVNNQEFYWQAINDAGSGGGSSFKMTRSAQEIQTFEGQNSGVTWFEIDNANQRVGVGTSIASAVLDVRGNPWFRPNETGAKATALRLGRFSDSASAAYDIITDDAVGDSIEIQSNRFTGAVRFSRSSPLGIQTTFILDSHYQNGTSISIADTTGTSTKIKLDEAGNTFFNNTGAVLVGTVSSTGTASQALQVNSGGYFNGSVGIGRTNPSALLHLNGGSAIGAILERNSTGESYIRYQNSSGTMHAGISTGATFWGIGDSTNFTTAPYFVVTNTTGNVGIGTTNPTSRLTVSGDALITGVSTFAGNVTFQNNAYFGDNDSANFGDGNDLQILHDGSNSVIKDVGTGNLVLAGDGAVDIYNSTISEVRARFLNNAAVELYYDNTKEFETTGYGATVFGILETQGLFSSGIATISVNSSSNALRITQLGSGNALVVEDETNPDATPFVVTATGDVGIGTTNTGTYALHINAKGASRGLRILQQTNDPEGGAENILAIFGNKSFWSTNDSASIQLGFGRIANTYTGDGTNWDLRFLTGSSASPTEKLRITGGGAVLVGTATSTGTASQTLQVTGSAYVSGNLGVGVTNPGAKLVVDGDVRLAALDAEIEFNTGGARLKGRSNALSIHTGGGLDTETSEQVRINTTGVGIGTTNPTAKLNVVDNSSSDAVRITQLGAGNALVVEDSTNPDITPFVINAGGAVGIGTTNPTSLLYVGPSNGNTLSHLYLASGNNAYGWRFDTQDFNAGSVPLRIFRRVNGTDTEAITVLNQSGNVGVGSTLPTAALTIATVGSATTGASQIYLNGATSNRIDFNQNGVAAPAFATRSAGTKIVLYPNIGAAAADYAMGVESGHIWQGVSGAGAAQGFKWYGGTTELAVLKGDGNFGIGITNPQQKLDVRNGTILVVNPDAAGLRVLSGAATSYATMGIGRSSVDASISVVGASGQWATDSSSGDLVIRTETTSTKLLFTNGANNATFAVANNNVGIGTTAPTSKLTVNGDALITGILTATNGLQGEAFESYEIDLIGYTGYHLRTEETTVTFDNTNTTDSTLLGTTVTLPIEDNGFTEDSTFVPSFNGEIVAIQNPFRLMVTVNGVLQSAFINNTDYVYQTNFLGSYNGYTIDSDNNIKFTESIPTGSDVVARVLPVSNTATKIKNYPFKPTDIVLGY